MDQPPTTQVLDWVGRAEVRQEGHPGPEDSLFRPTIPGDPCTLRFRSLRKETTQEEIIEAFKPFGDVCGYAMGWDETGCDGTVTLGSVAQADAALSHFSGGDSEDTEEDGEEDGEKDVHGQLYEAAAEGDLEGLTSALQNGADVDVPHRRTKLTPLAVAAYHGRLEAVKLLAPKVRSINNHTEDNGYTVLHFAAEEGHEAVVSVLARDFGHRIDVVDSVGETPLHKACRSGHQEVVVALREMGASLVAPEYGNGMTALLAVAACRTSGGAAIAEYLVTEGALLNEPPYPLREAFHNQNNPAVASALISTAVRENPLDSYWEDDTQKSTLYYAAALGVSSDVMESIIASMSPTVRQEWNGAGEVEAAAKGGHIEVVFTLLQAGASACLLYRTFGAAWEAIEQCGSAGDLEGLKELMTPEGLAEANEVPWQLDIPGASLDDPHADDEGRTESIYKFDVRAVDDDGRTGLSIIVGMLEWTSRKQVQFLLEIGADVNQADAQGKTAIHWACDNGTPEILELLLTSASPPADLERADNAGWRPIHYVANRNDAEPALFEALVREGADGNVTLPDGQSILHLAVRASPHGNMIRPILERFPDLATKPDNLGVRPVDLLLAEDGGDVGLASWSSWSDLSGKVAEGPSIKDRFLSACASGDHDQVAKLVEGRCVNLEWAGADGNTAIHLLSKRGAVDTVRLLLEAKPELANLADSRGRPPLHAAAESGQVPVISLLLESAWAWSNTERHSSPLRTHALHLAASAGVLEAVKTLLRAGALVDAEDEEGRTPAERALQAKADEEVVHLLQSSAELCRACVEGNIIEVERLLKSGAEVNAFGTGPEGDWGVPSIHGPPLALAIICNHADIVALLLEKGASPQESATDKTPYLDLAVEAGSMQMVEMVSAHGARSNTALAIAVEKGSVDIVRVLLANRKPDWRLYALEGTEISFVNSPLCGAARLGHTTILDMLLKAGAGDSLGKRGVWHDLGDNTPLWHAARSGQVGVVDVLLDASTGDVSIRDELSIAAANGHEGVVRRLLEAAKTKPYSCSLRENLRNAVHVAVESGHEGVALFLINQDPEGAEDPDAEGTTLLMKACKGLMLPIVKRLLDAGVEQDVVDKKGSTARDYAGSQQNEAKAREVKELLSKRRTYEPVPEIHFVKDGPKLRLNTHTLLNGHDANLGTKLALYFFEDDSVRKRLRDVLCDLPKDFAEQIAISRATTHQSPGGVRRSRGFDPVCFDDAIRFPSRPHGIALKGGDSTLEDLLQEGRTLDRQQVRYIFYSMAQCVSQLHSRGYVHGDLRPSNWLKSYDGFYRITGLQNAVNKEKDEYDTQVLPLSPIDPPEKARAAPFATAQAAQDAAWLTKGVDTWQLGALLFQMATGESLVSALLRARAPEAIAGAAPGDPPQSKTEPNGLDFESLLASLDQAAVEDLLVSRIPSAGADAGIKRQIQELLKNLLQVHPDNRLDVDGVLTSPFIQGSSEEISKLSIGLDRVISSNRRIEATTTEIAGVAHAVLQKTIGVGLLVDSVQARLKGMEATLLDKLKDTQSLIFSASDITMPRSFVVLPKARDHEAAWKVAQEYAETVTDLAKTLVSGGEEKSDGVFDTVVTFLVDHVSGNVSLTTNKITVQLLCEGCWSSQGDGYEIRQPKAWVKRLAPALSTVLFVTAGLGMAAQVLMPPAGLATKAMEGAVKNLQKVSQDNTPELVKAALNAGAQKQDGAAAREFGEFLKEHDPKNHWASLNRCAMDGGRVLWVCNSCRKEGEGGLGVDAPLTKPSSPQPPAKAVPANAPQETMLPGSQSSLVKHPADSKVEFASEALRGRSTKSLWGCVSKPRVSA